MRKKTAVLAAVLAGSLLCTACGDTPQTVQRRDTETEVQTTVEQENGTAKENTAGAERDGTEKGNTAGAEKGGTEKGNTAGAENGGTAKENTAGAENGGTEEGGGENAQDEIRTDVIGGADGPTAIFIARKLDGEEETEGYVSLSQSAEETEIDPEGTAQVYLDAVLDSGNGELGAVIHGPFGAAFLQREEASSPFWSVAVSADMKAVDASYMEGPDSTEVLAGGRSIFIFQKEDGQITTEYELQADGKSLYRDEAEEGGERMEWFASTLREIDHLSGKSARKEAEERAENPAKGREKQPEKQSEKQLEKQPEKQLESLAEELFTEIKDARGKTLQVYDCFTQTDGTKVYLCSDGDTLADLCLVLVPEGKKAAEQKAERIVWESGS